ncbi:uncharacterized protein LOC107038515 [Diachasma alloeum]|uniref:uncharacterized protein LOC107038515 n=1 Tax=Diachasma alloeum TaxID=454923 RepID=UPI0007384829|nr:uncharacterized protein LOC107038515 [Diachasma alloeum]
MTASVIFALSLLFAILVLVYGNGRKHTESPRREPKFISFNSEDGKIDVDLDLSIPFISIPLGDKDEKDGPRPLVNINTKSITVAGILAAITAFVIPLLFKTPSHPQYRFDDEFSIWDAGRALNELVLGNNYVTPCIQRAICGAIARVDRVNTPTGADKIVDGLANLKLIKDLINGTSIQEAVDAGHHSNEQCLNYFGGCKMAPEIFEVLLTELGIQ